MPSKKEVHAVLTVKDEGIVDREAATKENDEEVNRDGATVDPDEVDRTKNTQVPAAIIFHIHPVPKEKSRLLYGFKAPQLKSTLLRFKINESLIFGRGEGVTILFNDESASRKHMQLTSYLVRSLADDCHILQFKIKKLSKQPLKVNNADLRPGEEKTLNSRDVVQLGHNTFTVEINPYNIQSDLTYFLEIQLRNAMVSNPQSGVSLANSSVMNQGYVENMIQQQGGLFPTFPTNQQYMGFGQQNGMPIHPTGIPIQSQGMQQMPQGFLMQPMSLQTQMTGLSPQNMGMQTQLQVMPMQQTATTMQTPGLGAQQMGTQVQQTIMPMQQTATTIQTPGLAAQQMGTQVQQTVMPMQQTATTMQTPGLAAQQMGTQVQQTVMPMQQTATTIQTPGGTQVQQTVQTMPGQQTATTVQIQQMAGLQTHQNVMRQTQAPTQTEGQMGMQIQQEVMPVQEINEMPAQYGMMQQVSNAQHPQSNNSSVSISSQESTGNPTDAAQKREAFKHHTGHKPSENDEGQSNSSNIPVEEISKQMNETSFEETQPPKD